MESKRARMTPSEVSLFCQQVELLLQAGIPLYEGMRSPGGELSGHAVPRGADGAGG